jgi:cellulose synthase/poly-beta-1,6-N-acetylglucosamine synthase-like glycosyltransferase
MLIIGKILLSILFSTIITIFFGGLMANDSLNDEGVMGIIIIVLMWLVLNFCGLCLIFHWFGA